MPGLRNATLAALRAPGPWVPGWFPLVAEPAHRALRVGSGEVEAELLGVRMSLDLAEYTQRRYFWSCYEAPELHFLQRVARPGDVVVDVGAHVGLVSLVAARLVGPAGRVLAFEPVPETFDRLGRNVALNGFQNVQAVRAAVGERPGVVEIGQSAVAQASGSTGGFTLGGEHDAVSADLVPLDAALATAGVEPPRIVKIDAEGAEPRVLEGMSRLLSEQPPRFVLFELNSGLLLERGSSGRGVVEHLRAYGYELARPNALGRLRPLPSLERLARAAERSRQAGGGTSVLRAGVSQRDAFFNAVAVYRG